MDIKKEIFIRVVVEYAQPNGTGLDHCYDLACNAEKFYNEKKEAERAERSEAEADLIRELKGDLIRELKEERAFDSVLDKEKNGKE